jgi:hypothetical protein
MPALALAARAFADEYPCPATNPASSKESPDGFSCNVIAQLRGL